ncbi:hypothetical protein CIB95_04600 [Lottiidibacillus patelloidae]|uniref:YqhG n=1 Tax=Lottiidibacillus patelloidae TaxID=2670334 RepID=A0A263BVD5_9BACI|nr:YqhG family protein [Lottiidibacillus patelloidae]OZM57655.1 hypothetical protein CIB95_04600 [Lottiidibacillus patelloidae]
MQQEKIYNYLERFFTSTDCAIVDKNDSYMTVQLSIEMDKMLMNRPFYWHYLEKTGGNPNPMKLTLVTDNKNAPEGINGEFIHFGSPRLHQIFKAAKEMGGYIRLYENIKGELKTPLHPWIEVNAKISYICDRRKDNIISLGLNLINGSIVEEFHHKITDLSLTPKIPDFCFTLAPLIKHQSGLNRLKKVITEMIENDDLSWVESAKERWNEDQQLLNHFYEDVEEKPETFYNEKSAIKEQYEPRINVEVINGGLFYLSPNAIK